MRKSRKTEAGQIVVLTAVLLPLLLGMGAMALDLTYLDAQRQASQLAADAAAQSGAIALANGSLASAVKADAINYAAQNGFNSGNSAVTVNIPPKSPPASGTYPSGAVQVVISLNLNPILAGALGITGLTSSVQAVAVTSSSMEGPGGLWVLDKTAPDALQVKGTACVDVAGTIYVDSSSSSAIGQNGVGCGNGAGIESSIAIADVGGYSSGCCSPTPSQISQQFSDPLAAVPLPYYSSGKWYTGDGTQLSSQTQSGTTLNPGVYSGGISANGGNLTLNPGVYVMDGGGFTLKGNATLSGNGVFIYNSDSTNPSKCGVVDLSGGGAVTLTSPTSGIYQGIAFGQDRSCSATANLVGNGGFTVTGALYFPDATLQMKGTTGTTINGAIVVDQLQLVGNAVTIAKPDVAHTPQVTSVQLVE